LRRGGKRDGTAPEIKGTWVVREKKGERGGKEVGRNCSKSGVWRQCATFTKRRPVGGRNIIEKERWGRS